ncbi:TPA: 4-(cytidine 5'-diphospho)-2-C-methyl-D-erythritol kinase [Candidatus Poribacteria bacterium]|nr:4-(cytidine 5'-diphospho)-2-C-methyl-D-erythritol kinase [Candidatus Poribacteria bacterium]
MQKLRIKTRAKINLFLNVLYKRPDGYHEIETVFQSIGLADDIILRKLSRGIEIKCDHPQVPSDESNLAYRAAELFFKISKLSEGVEITIEKRIPVAAGLGGGSADAAGVLVGLNRLFELGYEREQLMRLGAKLGADVPFCILGGTALGRGIGEILTPLPPLGKIWLVIVNPGFTVSTASVYQNLPACISNFVHTNSQNKNFGLTKCPKNVNILIQHIRADNLPKICPEMFNALETVVVNRYPVTRRLKNQLKEFGALSTLMSGSGPTVFALMPDEFHAKSAAGKLSAETPFCIATTTSPVGVTIL